jgi:hypothetical protein
MYIQCTSKDFNVSSVHPGNRLNVSKRKVQIEVGLHEGNKECKFHSITNHGFTFLCLLIHVTHRRPFRLRISYRCGTEWIKQDRDYENILRVISD